MRKPSGIVAGILLTILSGLALATMDTGAKYLTGRLPVLEVVWARYFFHAMLMTAWLAKTRGTTFLKTRRPLLQLTRGGALLTATAMMYLGLSKIPLADATAVMFFAPVLVTVLSVVFLGERIGLPRIAAVLAGFGGVLLIVRPGFADTDPYLLLPLGAAIVVSVYFLLTRALAGPEENAATLFHTTAAGAVILSLVVPFVWEPPSVADFALMVGIGTLGALGHFCLVSGFAYASASTLTPFLYAQVLFAGIYSVVLIGDPLRPTLVIGAAILIASGLTIWWRENRRKA
ncbi:MAG TPA: DMT family transporter [Aurantimonas sp.]|uniref:DMT family transporter n=1 Tax=Aurantimonas marianensis TaxID=2920428 RepID=A0A9X2H6B7_9HYPH|nr:DMT family transporter [Aurantimonas marianensis]MCP3055011.1 DMT family transporter [Aurantimonas marianensis]